VNEAFDNDANALAEWEIVIVTTTGACVHGHSVVCLKVSAILKGRCILNDLHHVGVHEAGVLLVVPVDRIVHRAMWLNWNARVIVHGGPVDFVSLGVDLLFEVSRSDSGIVRGLEMIATVMDGVLPWYCYFVRSECKCLCLGVTDLLGIHLRHGAAREENDLREIAVGRARVHHVVHGQP